MSQEDLEGDLTDVLEAVASGRDLDVAEAEATFDRIMSGSAQEVQMAGLLVGLRAKGIQPSEVAGGVRALRKAMLPVACSDPDRMVDTAGTLTEGARALSREGASSVSAVITHPILSGPAIKRISESPLNELVVTDTVPLSPDARDCEKIRVVSIAPLLGEAVNALQAKHGEELAALRAENELLRARLESIDNRLNAMASPAGKN